MAVYAFAVESPNPSTADLARMLLSDGNAPLGLLDLEDHATIRGLVFQRLRHRASDMFDRLVILSLLPQVGVDDALGEIAEIARDGIVHASSRACATLLLALHGAGRFNVDLRHEPPERGKAVLTEKIATELVLQFPAPGLSNGLLRLFGTEGTDDQRTQRFAWLDGIRRSIGLPASLAFHAWLGAPLAESVRTRAADLITAEGGLGAQVLMERIAPGPLIGAVIERMRGGADLQRTPAKGRAYVLDEHEGGSFVAFVVHLPGGINLASGVTIQPDGELRCSDAAVVPGRVAVAVEGDAHRKAREASLAEGLALVMPAVEAQHARSARVDWPLVVTLCVLDGEVPASDPKISGEHPRTSN